jgi:2-oxo-3-hexenedioate decarboxylase
MWGAVYDRTIIRARENKAIVPLAGLVQPRIEPEICFRLQARPAVSKDPQALLDCIEWIAHSVEIVQCRHPQWKVTIADCTADNGLHGRLIVGTPVRVEKISGLLAFAFLVEILSKQSESPPLQAGEIISTGTLTDAHPVAPGERWSTDFHGFAVRGLEIEFT